MTKPLTKNVTDSGSSGPWIPGCDWQILSGGVSS